MLLSFRLFSNSSDVISPDFCTMAPYFVRYEFKPRCTIRRMQYEELLKRAMEKLPKERGSGERFEMPRVEGNTQGNSTIIKNFGEIATKLRRDPKHILKF